MARWLVCRSWDQKVESSSPGGCTEVVLLGKIHLALTVPLSTLVMLSRHQASHLPLLCVSLLGHDLCQFCVRFFQICCLVTLPGLRSSLKLMVFACSVAQQAWLFRVLQDGVC